MNSVNCRFCNWSRPTWWTTKRGFHRNGFDALREHMADKHPKEFAVIEKQCRLATSDALHDALQIAGGEK